MGRWVGMRVAHFKFIGEWVDGEESTFNLKVIYFNLSLTYSPALSILN